MELKSLLSISTVLIVLFSCSEDKDLVDNINAPISKEDSSVTIEKEEHVLVYDSVLLKEEIVKATGPKNAFPTNKASITENSKPYYEYTYKGVIYQGMPPTDSIYIMWPEGRIKDSLHLFVEAYDLLNGRLKRKGLEEQFSRDSFLWDYWQKQVLQADYRHQYVPYDSTTMKWGN